MDSMDIKDKSLDYLISRMTTLHVKMLETASTVNFYKMLASQLGLEDEIYKDPEQKKAEVSLNESAKELSKIKKHFAELLDMSELREMRPMDLEKFIFANYQIIDDKLVMRFERIYAVNELTEEMINKGADELNERRIARLEKRAP